MSGVKRPNESSGSPLPAKLQKSDSGKPIDVAAQLAAAKAQIAAKMAAFNQKNAAGSAAQQQQPVAPVPSRPVTSLPQPPQQAPSPLINADIAARIAAAKARIDSLKANSVLPPASSASTGASPRPTSTVGEGRTTGSAPLGIHPSLLENASTPSAVASSSKDRNRTMAPKFSSLKANARNASSGPPSAVGSPASTDPATRVNPYLAAAAASSTEEDGGITAKARSSRKFHFNQKGKYVAQAEQLRADANMEALKQRIAESARKAGLDSEFDALEKVIRREAPPDIEWWDEPLLPSKSYDDLATNAAKISTDDSPITIYVQHPVQIAAPWDKKKVEARPLMLTKKEAKKMRRQRRLADLKDKQDRVRMGLIPPDAPKVSVANLMRVLANDAISDPTKIEAKVKREVAARRLKHEKTNKKNKLTHDQRKEKEAKEKEKDEEKGLYAAVFKIKYLVNPAHKFKVRENAKQNSLTGCCIFNPKFTLVLVEGSAKAIKFYKRVLLVRIDWTEEPRAREADPDDDDSTSLAAGGGSGPGGGVPLGEDGEPVDLDTNRCDLIWEGPIKEKSYGLFRSKNAEGDKAAREFLGEANQGYWDVAAKFVPEEE